jgi:quercetin dioxygenase-like cupin family protein
MKINHYSEIEKQPVEDTTVSGVSKRILISAKDNAPNFTMRLFHVEPGGYTYYHSHDFEHEAFIIEGAGEIVTPGGVIQFKTGFAIFVEPGEVHQFRNTGKTRLSFLCLVPNRAA